MEKLPNQQETSEANLLHLGIYSTIDDSSLKQIILTKSENLQNIEQVTGPSNRTQVIRREIEIMENQLRLRCRGGAAVADIPGLPA